MNNCQNLVQQLLDNHTVSSARKWIEERGEEEIESLINFLEELFNKRSFKAVDFVKYVCCSPNSVFLCMEKVISLLQEGKIEGNLCNHVISELHFSISQLSECMKESDVIKKAETKIDHLLKTILHSFFKTFNQEANRREISPEKFLPSEEQKRNGCIASLELIPALINTLNTLHPDNKGIFHL